MLQLLESGHDCSVVFCQKYNGYFWNIFITHVVFITFYLSNGASMDWNIILSEISFRTSRSSGAGGQHVNKTETKVEALLDVNASLGLTEKEKMMVLENMRSRITDEGILAITSQKSRSQLGNKENVLERMEALILKAITPKVKRIRTRPSKQSIEDRLQEKKVQSEKKALRKKPGQI